MRARGNFLVQPHYSLTDHPPIDVLIIVGGVHTGEIKKASVIRWVKAAAESADTVASVCTGAFFLAEAGLLNDRSATTHWEDIPDLRAGYPDIEVREKERWVQDGKFVTSGGISAGIDMSLFLVSKILNVEWAQKTARQMEYRWSS